jgi:hypothetical protein
MCAVLTCEVWLGCMSGNYDRRSLQEMDGLDTLWRKRPLSLKAFLPPDNAPSATEPEFAWLDHASRELSWLLRLRFPRFASYAFRDPSLRLFLDSYLRFRRRPYDSPAQSASAANGAASAAAAAPPVAAGDAAAMLAGLDRRVLVLCHRLSFGAGLVAPGEAPSTEASAFGDALCGDGGPLALPQLLDVAALFGPTDPAATSE